MITAVVALFTALLAGMFSAFFSEMYKRHRDTTSAAAALAGELASYREAYNDLNDSIEILIDRAESGEPLNIPSQEPVPDVAFAAYIDKVGLLGPKLAEDVTYVYGQIRGFRSCFYGLTTRETPLDPKYAATILRVCHHYMLKANRRGEPLIAELTQIAQVPFPTALRRTVADFKKIWLGSPAPR